MICDTAGWLRSSPREGGSLGRCLPSKFSAGRVFLETGTAYAKAQRYEIQEAMSCSLSNGSPSPLGMSRVLQDRLGYGKHWGVSPEVGARLFPWTSQGASLDCPC